MNRKFLKNLEQMKGKTFNYARQVHCITDYEIDEAKEKATIRTNLTVFDRKFEAMDEFLKYWEPVTSTVQVVDPEKNELAVYLEQEKSMADTLIGILQDNIEKVRNSKEYIPQAQSINNNVNSIIEVQKMKMDMMKQLRKR